MCAYDRYSSQFKDKYFTEMSSDSEAGLVFKAHRLRVSLNSRLESNNEEKKKRLRFHGVA